MKENYFADNIETQARDFYKSIPHLRTKHQPGPIPNTTALLILDMQDYFLDNTSHAYIPSAPHIIPNIIALQDAFLEQNLPVILTQHVNTPQNAYQMKTWWKDVITPAHPLSSLTEKLNREDTEIIQKTQYDAFYNTNLETFLNKRGITRVIITGVMTHLCCETTARSAFVRNFEVCFTIDATATYNREFHKSTLLNLSHGFASPVLTCDILKFMKTNGKNT
ncbi:MAG: isochorismatase family protein [bacterium]|nr:isochorismatase family protein [bacterium]